MSEIRGDVNELRDITSKLSLGVNNLNIAFVTLISLSIAAYLENTNYKKEMKVVREEDNEARKKEIQEMNEARRIEAQEMKASMRNMFIITTIIACIALFK
jgi:predicted DNA repair protein MutK